MLEFYILNNAIPLHSTGRLWSDTTIKDLFFVTSLSCDFFKYDCNKEQIDIFDLESQFYSSILITLIGFVPFKVLFPTDGRGLKNQEAPAVVKRGPVPADQTARRFFGGTYLFDAIGEKLGIAQDLSNAFRAWNDRFYRLCITSFWRIKIHCIALESGAIYISILMAKTSPPSAAAKSLPLLRRRRRAGFSACRGSGEWIRSSGLTTSPPFPVIREACAKCNMVGIKKRIGWRK